MNLKDHIELHHSGNISEFARSQGVKPNQAQRWIDRGCKIKAGQVWCQVTKHKKVEL